MFKCVVCRGEDAGDETVDEVFKVDGGYARVDGVPSTVCRRCGERSFSRETAETVRLLVRGSTEPARTETLRVYKFA